MARQYTGSAGKITNCQVGVFAAYVSRHGHAFIDRALYLPKAWTDDPARLAAAHVPDGTGFATKPAIAVQMIKRAITAWVPFTWVAADSVYGVGDIKMVLRRAGKGYVLGVNATHHFRSWNARRPVAGTAENVARTLPKSAWRRLSAGAGTKGARLHDWAYCELADLDASDYGNAQAGLWTRGLLIRRNIANGDMAFFSTWCPAGTGIKALVKVEGHRWTIEYSFETKKNELGLDHNETRSWHGWHRHVALVMLAFAMLAAIRHYANVASPQKSHARHPARAAANPLVDPRNPPHRRKARAKTYPSRPCYRLVTLATRAPRRRSDRTYQTKIVTVMLGLCQRKSRGAAFTSEVALASKLTGTASANWLWGCQWVACADE